MLKHLATAIVGTGLVTAGVGLARGLLRAGAVGAAVWTLVLVPVALVIAVRTTPIARRPAAAIAVACAGLAAFKTANEPSLLLFQVGAALEGALSLLWWLRRTPSSQPRRTYRV